MHLFGKSLDMDVVVIAEVGNNHEGSLAAAEDMIWKAKEAGCDAVKFQTFKLAEFANPLDQARWERLKGFELPEDGFARLRAVADQAGITFFATPLDIPSAHFLNRISDTFKIASGDNDFYPLIEDVAGFGKPLIISGGLASVDHLLLAKALVNRAWAGLAAKPTLAFMHCVSAYPVPPAQANLAAIATMKALLGTPVGYSDHTLGIEAAVLSVAAGAQIIEKHFTLDKNTSDFRDHQLSADPAEMRELVERVKAAREMMGTGVREPQPVELVAREATRRSIVARHDMDAGAVVTPADIVWKRPGTGLAPGQEGRVLGRRLRCALRAGQAFIADLVD